MFVLRKEDEDSIRYDVALRVGMESSAYRSFYFCEQDKMSDRTEREREREREREWVKTLKETSVY